MQQVSSDIPAVTEAKQEAAPEGIRAELVLDGTRVIGELQGAHHRLVDILNTVDETFITIHNCELDGFLQREGTHRRLEVLHVRRSAILFAVPCTAAAPQADPFEAIEKVPVLATILLPGLEITGNVHMLPGVDPVRTPLLSTSSFVPLTGATVIAVQDGDRRRQEPIVVANLARVLLWGTQGR